MNKEETKIPNYVKRLEKYARKTVSKDDLPIYVILEIRTQTKKSVAFESIGLFRAACLDLKEAEKILKCLEVAATNDHDNGNFSFFKINTLTVGELYIRPAEFDWISRHFNKIKGIKNPPENDELPENQPHKNIEIL